jgi:hypothetical protein
MLLIKNILIDSNVLSSEFQCNVSACQGKCCIEGDVGAPLESEEIFLLESIVSKIEPFLDRKGIQAVRSQGVSVYFKKEHVRGTPLLSSGRCAYAVQSDNGIYQCGIESAYLEGAIEFKKPISCELYPIRIEKNHENGFDQMVYDRWDICDSACSQGKRNKLPLYKFVSKALIRKYGQDFYEMLDQYANQTPADKSDSE